MIHLRIATTRKQWFMIYLRMIVRRQLSITYPWADHDEETTVFNLEDGHHQKTDFAYDLPEYGHHQQINVNYKLRKEIIRRPLSMICLRLTTIRRHLS